MVCAAGYEWLDQPIALALHDALGPFEPAVRFITALGLAGPYLILAGLAAAGLWIAGRRVQPTAASSFSPAHSESPFLQR